MADFLLQMAFQICRDPIVVQQRIVHIQQEDDGWQSQATSLCANDQAALSMYSRWVLSIHTRALYISRFPAGRQEC